MRRASSRPSSPRPQRTPRAAASEASPCPACHASLPAASAPRRTRPCAADPACACAAGALRAEGTCTRPDTGPGPGCRRRGEKSKGKRGRGMGCSRAGLVGGGPGWRRAWLEEGVGQGSWMQGRHAGPYISDPCPSWMWGASLGRRRPSACAHGPRATPPMSRRCTTRMNDSEEGCHPSHPSHPSPARPNAARRHGRMPATRPPADRIRRRTAASGNPQQGSRPGRSLPCQADSNPARYPARNTAIRPAGGTHAASQAGQPSNAHRPTSGLEGP